VLQFSPTTFVAAYDGKKANDRINLFRYREGFPFGMCKFVDEMGKSVAQGVT
jgi:hypothetical protein